MQHSLPDLGLLLLWNETLNDNRYYVGYSLNQGHGAIFQQLALKNTYQAHPLALYHFLKILTTSIMIEKKQRCIAKIKLKIKISGMGWLCEPNHTIANNLNAFLAYSEFAAAQFLLLVQYVVQIAIRQFYLCVD